MSDLATIGGLLRLARDTVTNPREGAETVLSFAPPRQALVLMFALVVVLSILLGEVVALLSGPVEEGPLTGRSPVVLGGIQAAFLYIMIHAIHRIGRWFGGGGAFEEAALLVIWLQAIFVVVQVIQIGTLVFLPPLMGLVTLAALGVFLWLLVNFIAVLHGFTSLGMVFLMTIASGFAIVFLMSLLLAILGLVPDTGGSP